MSVSITIPSPGESITEVTVGAWLKSDGDWVEQDEAICEIESDKATLEVGAPTAGVLHAQAEVGEELQVGAVLGTIEPGEKSETAKEEKESKKPQRKKKKKKAGSSAPKKEEPAVNGSGPRASSMARKLAAERGVDLEAIPGSGPAGRVMKADVLSAVNDDAPAAATTPPSGTKAPPPTPSTRAATAPAPPPGGTRTTRRERMTKLRQKIAERLVSAQQTAAMLTTFNEADMTNIMRLRASCKDAFVAKYGVKLGFMSFFIRAAVSALQAVPKVNAFIIDNEIEYHDYCDIAVAVGTDRGLVVPVIRNAEVMNSAELEATVADFAVRARDGQLSVDEMTGGTFTISNGGVYGSLMSTPILNPPQSGILGMHTIKKRPIEDPQNPGQIVLRPMMYLAFSYDHRVIDGTEAVGFLKHIKDCVEDPGRLMLDV